MSYPQPHQHLYSSPRRQVSGRTIDMNAVHQYQAQAAMAASPATPGSTTGTFPLAYMATPTSASPGAQYARYQPSVFAQHGYGPQSPGFRRPSVSPRRTSGDSYNPQDYGVLGRDAQAGVVHSPSPAPAGEDAPPPPYSPPSQRPPVGGRQAGAPSPLPLQRQPHTSWAQSSGLQTPLTASAFSPQGGYMAGSSAATTPMSAFPQSGTMDSAHLNGQQPSSPFSPQGMNVPPPPPGPPPRAISQERQDTLMRSASGFYRDSSPQTSSGLRNETSAAPAAPSSNRSDGTAATARATTAPPTSQPRSSPEFRSRAVSSNSSNGNSQQSVPSTVSPIASRRETPTQPAMGSSRTGLTLQPVPPPKRKMSIEEDLREDRLSPRLAPVGGDANPWTRIRSPARSIEASSPISRGGSGRAQKRAFADGPSTNATGLLSPAKDAPKNNIDGASENKQAGGQQVFSPKLQKREVQHGRQLLTPPPSDNLVPKPKVEIPTSQNRPIFQSFPQKLHPLSPVGEEVSMDPLYIAAIARHNEMIAAEAFATTDEERLRIFVKYVQEECRHRSRMYPAAVEKMKRWLKESQVGFKQEHIERDTEMADTVSPISARARPESRWWGQYLSNKSVDGRTEDSRGRASSRWWEASVEGGSVSDAVRSDADEEVAARRYKRRSSLREIAQASAQLNLQSPHPSDAASYHGRAEFPPENKEGPSGIVAVTSPRPANANANLARRPSNTPLPRRQITRLDILPLLTLLPPYPPPFPAVNNAHPSLSTFRNLVRNLNEMEEIDKPQREFDAEHKRVLSEFTAESEARKERLNERLERAYRDGRISFGDVGRHREEMEGEEKTKLQEVMKTLFDRYNNEIVEPVHGLLSYRIELAEAAYSSLKETLSVPLPPLNATEETPSLQETLTVLKWLFELLETLHARTTSLLETRNSHYKTLITAPLTGSRLQSATTFFTQDALKTSLAAHQSALTRTTTFIDLFEAQVTQGVETLISSFWDSAPLVAECFEKMPADLSNVVPIVPREEAHENPHYEREPMRYLLEKVVFSEKSMYSLIEAKTELLCLLHEVKGWGVRAGGRVRECEAGEGAEVRAEVEREERRLTEDLKEKVRVVEEEWRGVLGERIERCRKRVEEVVGEREGGETPA